ncbi:MAG: YdhR family protein [Dehalococcoidia bacterium]|nr:YdhR family protein [Dehalococcoidia bacterium]
MTTPLFALQVMWDLGPGGAASRASFEELRAYVRERSVPRFEQMAGLRQKTWISNPETGRWGALYLFDTPEQRQAVVDAVNASPVGEMTGVQPSFEVFDVEAVVEGVHAGADLGASGLAR